MAIVDVIIGDCGVEWSGVRVRGGGGAVDGRPKAIGHGIQENEI